MCGVKCCNFYAFVSLKRKFWHIGKHNRTTAYECSYLLSGVCGGTQSIQCTMYFGPLGAYPHIHRRGFWPNFLCFRSIQGTKGPKMYSENVCQNVCILCRSLRVWDSEIMFLIFVFRCHNFLNAESLYLVGLKLSCK